MPTANIQDGQWEKQMREEGMRGKDLYKWEGVNENRLKDLGKLEGVTKKEKK